MCKREARRREVRVLKHGRARDAIGSIEAGFEVYVVSMGQFSLIDVLGVVLEQTGPADVDLCTWTVEGADLERMAVLQSRGLLRSARWILDRSWRGRRPECYDRLIELFGPDSLRMCSSHAKFIAVRNGRWNVAVRTSMNLNENRRMEHIEIGDDPALCGFLGDVTGAIFDERLPGTVAGGCPDLEAIKNSKIDGMLTCKRLVAPRISAGIATAKRLEVGPR